MNYADYLHSPEWQTLRQRAIERDGKRCRICNSNKRLEVHHRVYVWDVNHDPIDDLTTLCYRCHKLFTYSVQKPDVPVPKAKYQPKKVLSEVDRKIQYERGKRNVIVFGNQLRKTRDKEERRRLQRLIAKWEKRTTRYEDSAWDKIVPTIGEMEEFRQVIDSASY
jgi:hypothetical protein